jgi:hypothetical protein
LTEEFKSDLISPRVIKGKECLFPISQNPLVAELNGGDLS